MSSIGNAHPGPVAPESPTGRHLLAEYRGCDVIVLADSERLDHLMREAAEAACVVVVSSVFHCFDPQGVTGVLVLAESHFSIHTWPEHCYAAVDFFTCGRGCPERAAEVLRIGLRANTIDCVLVERGGPLGTLMKLEQEGSDAHRSRRIESRR